MVCLKQVTAWPQRFFLFFFLLPVPEAREGSAYFSDSGEPGPAPSPGCTFTIVLSIRDLRHWWRRALVAAKV